MAAPHIHPVARPPEQYPVPQAPVRDPDALGPSEDLDRQPDGVPHQVVGLTALFSVVLAMLVAVMFITGKTTTQVAAVILGALAVPVIVSTLRRKAERERDWTHPSR